MTHDHRIGIEGYCIGCAMLESRYKNGILRDETSWARLVKHLWTRLQATGSVCDCLDCSAITMALSPKWEDER